MTLEKVKDWFFDMVNELILFLEYPLDYIIEFGDDLKKQDATGKIIKIGKLLITIYLCIQLIMLVLFVVLLFVFLGGGSSAGDAYTNALKASRGDLECDVREGKAPPSALSDLDQEIRNNTREGE